MPQYRGTFIFQQFSSGWSEQWYYTANDLADAVTFSTQFLGNFLAIRGVGVTLIAIRANDVAVKRRSRLKVYNVSAPGAAGHGVAGDSEPPGVAALGYVVGANDSRRPLLLRGLSDFLVVRDQSGAPIFPGGFQAAFARYVTAVKSNGFQIRSLTPFDVGNPDRTITQLAPAANGEMTAVQFVGGPDFIVGDQLIFHGLNRNLFQGFAGPLPAVAVGAGTVTVPVRWQNAGNVAPGLTAKVRKAGFSYNNVTDIFLEDVRTKKVGAPSIRTRGRRKGIRVRAR